MKFYFTYGTARQYPYCGGWTEVIAKDRYEAVQIFRQHHKDIHDGIVNCAEIYSEESFRKTKMAKQNSNLGNGCMEVLEG